MPTASGATSATAGEPKVIEVTTDTPLGAATPHHPGAPVNPGPYSVEQPDGSRITITAWGDSRTSGYQTKGGYAVTKDASGVWRYAVRLDAAGRPVASDLQVGKAAPPAAARGLRTKVVERARTARAAAEARAPRRAPGTGNGPQPGLVILVSFANQASVGSTEDQWAQDFFGAGSSVSGYYQANSFGKFALVPAAESAGVANNGVVGWLQLPYDHPNFGNDYDASETKLGVDAVTAADPYVDYASFDTDKDGSLSVSELHVTVIVAGYETSYGGLGNVCGNSVWGHQGGLHDSAPKLDGTVVNRSGGTMFGEWMCTPSNAPGQKSTIGVMVHEMGHDIGFPDLYDTDLTSAGVAKWSAMSTGSWNRVGTAFSGTTPAGMDAFSKSYQGWLAPTPVVGAINGAPLPSSATSPTAYRLGANPDDVDWKFEVRKGAGEYFLVENRQLVGWDAGLPACGVIVYHVDEGVTFSNKANADESHRLVDVVEADGTPGHEHLRLPRLGRGRVPRLQRPRRLHGRDEPGGDALLRPVVGCGDARQRRVRRPDERQPLHPAAERLVRDGHRADGHRVARSPAATTARPRRPASRPSRPTPEGRRSGTGSGLRPPAPCGSRPRARPSTPCSGSTAARRSPRSRRSRATTT